MKKLLLALDVAFAAAIILGLILGNRFLLACGCFLAAVYFLMQICSGRKRKQ